MIGIARIDCYLRDLLTIAQPEMGPGLPAISRFVKAVANREVGAMQSFTTPDVNNVRIRNRDCDCADGSGRLVVKDRLPGAAGIVARNTPPFTCAM